MRTAKTLLLCILVTMLAAMPLPASAVVGDYFSVSGRVTDANWNPIPGALVTLSDNDFNRITTQNTNGNGYFSFERVSVKTNLCNVRISYTDGNGTYYLPGYYIPAFNAHGEQQLTPEQTHFDNYYLPGSQPHVTPTPMPVPTLAPANTPAPTAVSDDGQATQALIFGGGFIGGMVTATLACLIIFRRPGIK